jgi:hypothetical protein
MKCALCQHRAKFQHVGRQRHGGKLFRCPRCKLDQAKGIGTGVFLVPGEPIDLDVPPQTSLYKARWERLFLVDRGFMRREDMTRPSSQEEFDEMVREHAADVAENAGFDDIAQMMRKRPPTDEPG